MRFQAVSRLAIALFLAAIPILASAQSPQEKEWISQCGQCLSPHVTSKSGIGTSNAVAEGKISREDAEAWCQNWEPQNPLSDCVKDQLANEDPKTVYRITADCTKGSITAVNGEKYTRDGVWTDDIGKGRSRFRDSAGKIVGQDEASGGLAIAQQWELLCYMPKTTKPTKPAAASATPATKSSKPAAAAAPNAAAPASPRAAMQPALKPAFAVGDIVEAKFGSKWIRGKVMKIRESQGRSGPELNYDITLDNGQRGVLPASMVRKAQ